MYLLQLVQALRYENFKKPIKTTNSIATTNVVGKLLTNEINRTNQEPNTTQQQQNIFDLNLKTFLIGRAKSNEIVADCLYWYVKVEMGDKLGEQDTKTNFHLFMDELIDALQNVSFLLNLQGLIGFETEKCV